MTDDLVKRLRDRGVCSIAQNSCRNDYVCEAAANEIERLTAGINKLVYLTKDYEQQIERLRAQVAKLRRALECGNAERIEALGAAIKEPAP